MEHHFKLKAWKASTAAAQPSRFARPARCSHGRMNLLVFLIVGTLATFVSRAIGPGGPLLRLPPTLAVGIGGALIAGIVGSALRSGAQWLVFTPSVIVWSALGALLALAVVDYGLRRSRRRARQHR